MAKVTIIFDDKKSAEYEVSQKVALTIDNFIIDIMQKESEFESAEELLIDYDITDVQSSAPEIGDLEIAIDEANSSGYDNPANVAEVNELKKKREKDGKKTAKKKKRNSKSSSK